MLDRYEKKLAEILERLYPYKENLVVIGGVSVALYHSMAGEELTDSLFTTDLDLGTDDDRIELRQKSVEEILTESGLEKKLSGREGYVKFEWLDDSEESFEVEFLMPLIGTGDEQTGTIPPNLKVPRLRYVDLLLESSDLENVRLANRSLQCQLPSPGIFVVHKALTAPKRRSMLKKQKDYAYILDILGLFFDEIKTLADQVEEGTNHSHKHRQWIDEGLRKIRKNFQPGFDPLLLGADLLPGISEQRGRILIEEFLDEVQEILE